jgi:hypothetical protein
MHTRFPAYAPVVLFLAIVTAACTRDAAMPTSPTPAVGLEASLAAEPSSPRPEFLHSFDCPTRPAFAVGLTIIISGRDDLILRAVRFAFTDRFGVRTLPDAIPVPSSVSTSLPVATPITMPAARPLPGSSPIPIPGSSPIQGLLVSAGASRSLPFFLRFGCGLIPDGTIVITADTADTNGRSGAAELKIFIRQP